MALAESTVRAEAVVMTATLFQTLSGSVFGLRMSLLRSHSFRSGLVSGPVQRAPVDLSHSLVKNQNKVGKAGGFTLISDGHCHENNTLSG